MWESVKNAAKRNKHVLPHFVSWRILLESKSFASSIIRKFQQIFIETLDIFVTSLQIAGSVKSEIYESYNHQMCFPALAENLSDP
jgi:hypothetical protein